MPHSNADDLILSCFSCNRIKEEMFLNRLKLNNMIEIDLFGVAPFSLNTASM